MKYYYKLLWKEGNNLLSWNVSGGRFCIKYKIGEFVKPKIGKLFIFKTKKSIKEWLTTENDPVIYSCLAKGVKKPEVKYIPANREYYKKFWDDPVDFEKARDEGSVLAGGWNYLPKGTLFADEVKLVEEINL